MKRPHYIIVSLWGDRFRRYFLDYCLPSLMTTANRLYVNPVPTILLACPDEDWRALLNDPAFEPAAAHFEIRHIKLPPVTPETYSYKHMGIGHVEATEIAFRDRALATIIAPDMIFSDGCLELGQRKAAEGYCMVFCCALRFSEEKFLPAYKSNKPRELAKVGMASLHSEVLTCEWDAPHLAACAPVLWWKAPNGIVLHNMSWSPIMLDYSALEKNRDWMIRHWTVDGSYFHDQWGDRRERIYVVRDSDECFAASWTPDAEHTADLTPIKMFADPSIGEVIKGAALRSSFPSFDATKRRIFFDPVRWHEDDVDEDAWRAVEAKAATTLRRFVAHP